MNRLCLAILILFAARLFGNELGDLLRQADENHPLLQAERAVVEQMVCAHDELAEFLDPSLYAAAGADTRLRNLPMVPAGYAQPRVHDSLEAQAGVQVPLESGAYISAGGVFRKWFHPDAGYDRMYQHLLGVNLQIPLLRDRGFALYGHRRSAAMAQVCAATNRLLSVSQTIRHDVETAYITACFAAVNHGIRQDATLRFEKTYEEARELARLKTIPEYQVQTALRDLQTGKEDQIAAEQTRQAALVTLAQTVGIQKLDNELACTPADFLQAALEIGEMPSGNAQDALQRRGELLALQDDWLAADAQRALEEEEHKDQLSLNLGVNWQGDSRHGAVSAYREYTDHNWGGEAMIVWTRPLDYAGSSARTAKAQARLKELEARQEALRIQITAEVRCAQLRFQAAVQRLALAQGSVAAAQSTLQAEQERFRLGESTSTIVLDAQKELNNILLRQSTAAMELLQANAELQYALGYPEDSN